MKEKSTSKLSSYKKAIEALLSVSGRVLTLKELSKVYDGLSLDEVDTYEGRGVIIREVAYGYRVETIPEGSEAIVAYFQPITRVEVSASPLYGTTPFFFNTLD